MRASCSNPASPPCATSAPTGPSVDVALRDAINRGDIIGPRMFVAGAYITITGAPGALTGLAPDISCPGICTTARPTAPGKCGRVIRKLAHNGVDHIKVLSSGAVLTHGSNPKSQEFTPEELQAAVDEASHFGLRVESHAHATEGIKNAIRAGVASVEHATLIDDEGIALAKQHGTYLDMDIYDDECIQAEGRNGTLPKDYLKHDADLVRPSATISAKPLPPVRKCPSAPTPASAPTAPAQNNSPSW